MRLSFKEKWKVIMLCYIPSDIPVLLFYKSLIVYIMRSLKVFYEIP